MCEVTARLIEERVLTDRWAADLTPACMYGCVWLYNCTFDIQQLCLSFIEGKTLMSSTFAMCTRSFSKSSSHLSRAGSDLIVQSGHSVRLFVRLPRRCGNATSLHTHPGQPAHHIALPPSPDDIYTVLQLRGLALYMQS